MQHQPRHGVIFPRRAARQAKAVAEFIRRHPARHQKAAILPRDHRRLIRLRRSNRSGDRPQHIARGYDALEIALGIIDQRNVMRGFLQDLQHIQRLGLVRHHRNLLQECLDVQRLAPGNHLKRIGQKDDPHHLALGIGNRHPRARDAAQGSHRFGPGGGIGQHLDLVARGH